MKITGVKENKEILTFTLEKSNSAYANALRRTMMNEVPVMAIDEVEFYDNTSNLFDEYIAHRLGLVPLTTDLKGYKLPSECCGGACSKCSATLSLEVEGPVTVYSGELKPKDKDVKPVYENIPIMKLTEGQKLKLDAKAVLGPGKKHAKWQGCLAAYKYLPEVKIKRDCNGCGKCVEACPKGILQKEAKKIKVKDMEKCIECRECIEACPKGMISIGNDETTFLFTLESYGSLKPSEILKEAVERLADKAAETKKLFAK